MTISTSDPHVKDVLRSCVTALRKVAHFELNSGLDQRLQELGERKEFLDEAERNELFALLDFSEQRTVEKLEAAKALQSLHDLFPEVVEPA